MSDKERIFSCIYEVSPIDFFYGARDLADAIVEYLRADGSDFEYVKTEIRQLIRRCEWCEEYVRKREGDLRGRARITFIPDVRSCDCALSPVFIVKADNNGTTYVFSSFPISDSTQNLI